MHHTTAQTSLVTELNIQVNGIVYAGFKNPAGGYKKSASIRAIVYLNVDDVVRVHGIGAMDGGDRHYFSGFYLSS